MKRARDEKYQDGEAPIPANFGDDVIISEDTRRGDRLPPRQVRTRKWPKLDATGTPDVSLADWQLEIFGLVDRPFVLRASEWGQLPRVKVLADFHCVTRWSRLGNLWEGVSTRSVLDRAGVRSEAAFVILHAYDRGWTTNLPLEEFLAEDALLADTHDGQPLGADHGGPVRVIIPQLYAWKSAKWVRGIELSAVDKPGYWERAGYHHHGDPWKEERFS